jgi:hypothetical protein
MLDGIPILIEGGSDVLRSIILSEPREESVFVDPPAGLRGPIKQHPDYPLRGNETRRPTPALGNYNDPILKPWAAEQMRLSNEEFLSGKAGIPFLAQSPSQDFFTDYRVFAA